MYVFCCKACSHIQKSYNDSKKTRSLFAYKDLYRVDMMEIAKEFIVNEECRKYFAHHANVTTKLM